MKKLLLLAAMLGTAASLFAQGTVNFANTSTTLITTNNGASGPISGSSGAYKIELLVGAAGSTDVSSFTTIATAVNSSTLAGRFFGGTQTNSLTTAGGPMAVLVRAYLQDSAAVTSYDLAFLRGQSTILQLSSSGNPNATPPGTPVAIFGPTALQGFALTPVPEPSSIALGLLGLGAVALFRRRK